MRRSSGMTVAAVVWASWLVVVCAIGACGNGGSNSTGTGGSSGTGGPGAGSADGGLTGDSGSGGTTGTASLWVNPTQPEIALVGGAASSPGGVAQAGGAFHLVSAGGISLDPSWAMPAAPAGPDPGANGTALSTATLAADVDAAGDVTASGMIVSGGTDAVRKINAAGDVVISGTLRGADLGGARQGFDIEAPGHVVFVSGTVDTSGAFGSGQGGGALTIVADQVIVTGQLLTAGGGGAQAGAAGAVVVNAAKVLFLQGTLDASGGDARGTAAATGGPGGAVTLSSGGDLAAGGLVRNRGGAASSTGANATGGDAGALTIDCKGVLSWGAALDGRGGLAMAGATGGTVAGGAAATLTVGGKTAPSAIGIAVPVVLTGGPGASSGGDGATAELDAKGGDLVIAGTLDVSGGDSAGKPGAGGTILGLPGPTSDMAATDISGKVVANGGSVPGGASPGAAVNGGSGGLIKLVAQALDGNATVDATGQVQADGGESGGSGVAGPGGLIYLFTKRGNISMHGQLLARGGAAPDSGGTGGEGGFVYVFSGDGHDRMSGILIIESDGVVDASGGAGTIGGSARNDGKKGSVAIWPVVQTDEFDVQQTAVLINSDGVHGSDHGYLNNAGTIIARGGASNGSGGDVQYHGKMQDGNETPLPGNVENTADGTGMAGDFAGE